MAKGIKIKCGKCEEYFNIDKNEDKYGIQWWTKEYCSADCAVLSDNAYLTKAYKDETVRFTISVPTHIYERITEDSATTERTMNGMINSILKNYYVAKDIQRQKY